MVINVQRVANSALKLADDLANDNVDRTSQTVQARVSQIAKEVGEVSTYYAGVLCGCLAEVSAVAQRIVECSDDEYAANGAAYRQRLNKLRDSISKHSSDYHAVGPAGLVGVSA